MDVLTADKPIPQKPLSDTRSRTKLLLSHTRKATNRLTALLRLAAVTVNKSNTALGRFIAV